MGLFFKKKTKELPPLDMPPRPTSFDNSLGELPPLPPVPKAGAMSRDDDFIHLQELPPLPKISSAKEEKMPEFPELPPLPEIEHEEEHFDIEYPKAEAATQEMPDHDDTQMYEIFQEGKNEHEDEDLTHLEEIKPLKELKLMDIEQREIHDMQPLFIKSDDYKGIMKNIQEIKSKANESDAILVNLNEIKNQKDKEFIKIHNQLADIQRKLVYVDKTVFGG